MDSDDYPARLYPYPSCSFWGRDFFFSFGARIEEELAVVARQLEGEGGDGNDTEASQKDDVEAVKLVHLVRLELEVECSEGNHEHDRHRRLPLRVRHELQPSY